MPPDKEIDIATICRHWPAWLPILAPPARLSVPSGK